MGGRKVLEGKETGDGERERARERERQTDTKGEEKGRKIVERGRGRGGEPRWIRLSQHIGEALGLFLKRTGFRSPHLSVK